MQELLAIRRTMRTRTRRGQPTTLRTKVPKPGIAVGRPSGMVIPEGVGREEERAWRTEMRR